VHGLNGHPFKTWTTEKTKKFWLKDVDLLPSNLKSARILTFGYNAAVAALLGRTSSDRILQHAQTLIAELVADREVSLISTTKFRLLKRTARRRSTATHYIHLSLIGWYRCQTRMKSLSNPKSVVHSS
jgi:hypothetical protein